MHNTSMELMKEFKSGYVDDGYKILDVGGKNVNGTYKELFPKCSYTTLDFEKADIVVHGYNWPVKLTEGLFDIVISGQTLEHDKFFWITLNNMKMALKHNGYMCIIVPSKGPYHAYPKDYYRFQKDSMEAFAEWMKIELIKTKELQSTWGDIMGVFRK